MPKNLYILKDHVLLKTHHIRSSVITRLRKGKMSVYDIQEKDVYNHNRYFLQKAEEDNLPVLLQVNNITRLLIFNKDYDKN
jgi:hypothetical protein